MKNICLLIDFTPTCHKAAEFAGNIAVAANAEITLVHIAPNGEKGKEAEIMEKMNEYKSSIPPGITCKHHVEFGSFYSLIPYTIKEIESDMVVVGTHGVVGIKQNLFGANILKLAQSLSAPCLIVQDKSKYRENLFSDILFPIAPHEDFAIKYKQVAQLAKLFNSTIHIIAIRKELNDLAPALEKNMEMTIEYFDANGIKHKQVREDATVFSIGYSQQIMDYAVKHNMGAVSIMSRISKDNYYFGKIDKENMILNEPGIPIYCTN